ncbi:NUDIX hydrolase [Sphingomonas oryzagri]|uniref:NUDIX domain-containing protein n=1 Tax=Sphingomonas oryzagri TaxID=3042314 RepID=A0ABT6N5U7_9SPHN|nr:NUDIX domain-containing protein [Sphingomonas oryzagri]MDH7640481.1 NUDIX domain-containing protein [Sphingomonas oryzagri]
MTIKQVAALPYRMGFDGRPEVMLITSRSDDRHWLPPKGHLIDGLEPHNAAAQEAHEEAGVIGEISERPIGAYRAQKIRTNGQSDDLEIALYPMRFVRREADWPEKGQRAILWFDPQDAARAVREAGLSRLLSEFRPF